MIIYFYYYNIMIKTKKNKPRKWTLKYKKSINCNRPKGFSQKQYCKYGRKTYKNIKLNTLNLSYYTI